MLCYDDPFVALVLTCLVSRGAVGSFIWNRWTVVVIDLGLIGFVGVL